MSSPKALALHRHPHPHRELLRRYRHYATQQQFRLSVLLALIVFAISLVINAGAIVFATDHASNPVTDIVLSNTVPYDVDALFVYGTFALALMTTLLCLAHPKRIPFVLHSLALFFIVRSAFVSLTHLATFEPHAASNFGETITRMFFGSDLFFSGHTGMPFLCALIFWKEIRIRYVYLATSLFFAAIVLLGHLHYSIDVASAFFITYGIFHIALWLFPKDWMLFNTEVPEDFI